MKSYVLLFFVSALAVLLTGCETSKYANGPSSPLSSMLGESGILDHSSVMVENPYPELKMQVKVAVGKVSQLGYSPFRWVEYPPMPAGCHVSARPPSMVVGQEAVLIGIEWFRPNGVSAGKASQVLYGLGGYTQAWHVRVRREIGQLDHYVLQWYHL